MSYNYEIAKTVLTENDKNRILALYLNCDMSSVKWEKATKDFRAKSVDSMRVMTRTIMKKIETAGGKEGVDASATCFKGGKKRKTDDDEEAATPAPKKRGRPAKKAKEAVVEEDDEEDKPEVGVKPEAYAEDDDKF